METCQFVLRERCNCSGTLTRRRRFLLGAMATGKSDRRRVRAVRLRAATRWLGLPADKLSGPRADVSAAVHRVRSQHRRGHGPRLRVQGNGRVPPDCRRRR